MKTFQEMCRVEIDAKRELVRVLTEEITALELLLGVRNHEAAVQGNSALPPPQPTKVVKRRGANRMRGKQLHAIYEAALAHEGMMNIADLLGAMGWNDDAITRGRMSAATSALVNHGKLVRLKPGVFDVKKRPVPNSDTNDSPFKPNSAAAAVYKILHNRGEPMHLSEISEMLGWIDTTENRARVNGIISHYTGVDKPFIRTAKQTYTVNP